jgi:ubiquitin carboxyl-terminal hydrolase 36/42
MNKQWEFSVHSWNGGKARLDREVNNQRRQERKRSFDKDDEELDRGRTKKIKLDHGNDKSRNDSKYNPFQQHQNAADWRHINNQYRPNNCHLYSRPRHGGGGNYNRPPHHRFHHNKSRNHWRR